MNIKTLQKLSVGVLVLAALIALVFEMEWIEPGLLLGDDTVQYVVDMVGAVITLIGIPLGMKMKSRPAVRLSLFALVIITSLLIYYLFYSSTTLACAAIGTVVLLLQWPTEKTVEI